MQISKAAQVALLLLGCSGLLYNAQDWIRQSSVKGVEILQADQAAKVDHHMSEIVIYLPWSRRRLQMIGLQNS